MPLDHLSTLIACQLQGASQALHEAEIHPDPIGRVCFMERARLRLEAAEQEVSRLKLTQFEAQIEQLLR